MTRLLIASLFATVLLASCNKTIPSCPDCEFDCIAVFDESVITSSDCLDNHECKFEVLTDSKVAHDDFSGISSSSNSLVIRFSTETEGSPNIADDEFTTTFLLEIPNVNESFSVSGETVKDLKTSVRRVCFCPNVDWVFIEKGCIQGEKKDGTWFIQGDVAVDIYGSGSDFEFKFDFEVQ